jgi:hypothetical protein
MKEEYLIVDPEGGDKTVKASLSNELCHKYSWMTGGQDSYKRWWKERLVTTVEDMDPASDDIAC